MDREQMNELVERHLRAEGAGDVEGAVAVYTDDIEHDVVGWPTGVLHGKEAARGFYRELTANFRTEEERPTRRYYASHAMILDQQNDRDRHWLDAGPARPRATHQLPDSARLRVQGRSHQPGECLARRRRHPAATQMSRPTTHCGGTVRII